MCLYILYTCGALFFCVVRKVGCNTLLHCQDKLLGMAAGSFVRQLQWEAGMAKPAQAKPGVTWEMCVMVLICGTPML